MFLLDFIHVAVRKTGVRIFALKIMKAFSQNCKMNAQKTFPHTHPGHMLFL